MKENPSSNLKVSPSKEVLSTFENLELNNDKSLLKNKKIIFHCEFSQCRGPKLYNLLRSFDREINFKRYPELHYPEIYLLEGGFSQFFPNFPVNSFLKIVLK